MVTKRTTSLGGYKHHRPGSLVGRLHECYDLKGEKAARKLAEKMHLAPSTVHVQLSKYRQTKPTAIAAGKRKAPRRAIRSRA